MHTPIQSVKKFYFLDYIYVILRSVERHSSENAAFDRFKTLKHEYSLGESKYKKNAIQSADLSPDQINRYRYTFLQVLEEAGDYGLLKQESGQLGLTPAGDALLSDYAVSGPEIFYRKVANLMEERYGAFRYLINFFYHANSHRQGLLIFPNYSPGHLGFERTAISNVGHLHQFFEELRKRLQLDISKYIGENRDLKQLNQTLITKLQDSGLVPESLKADFNPTRYYAILRRVRDFWLSYFLRDIYHYEHSLSSFEIWTYRGKQIGVIHATEFYPNFHGRITFPTAVVTRSRPAKDFGLIHEYDDGFRLYAHQPTSEKSQEQFVDYLVKGYFDLRKTKRSYFVSLMALRELVCYNLRIAEKTFDNLLGVAYKLNLTGRLKVKISLEVDRLPDERKAMYLKQEPVMVDGKYRNIIAIEISKRPYE